MNFEQISNVSHHYFRKLVMEKINILTRDYINEHRGTKMSKISDFKLQDYLVSKNISLKEKRILFKCRFQCLSFRENFHNQYKGDMKCILCFNHTDSQMEAYKCEKLRSNPDILALMNKTRYDDIYGSVEKQVVAAKLWRLIMSAREEQAHLSQLP